MFRYSFGPGFESGHQFSSYSFFSVTSVASLAAVQEKILANQTMINPQVHSHVDLGRGPPVSKPLNFYFCKSKAKRGPNVVVSAATEEWL
jgi:hypothetical protein